MASEARESYDVLRRVTVPGQKAYYGNFETLYEARKFIEKQENPADFYIAEDMSIGF